MTAASPSRPDRDAIDRLFEARCVAVVGASSDSTKLSSSPLNAMSLSGYQGTVYAVNPNYKSLQGRECYPSVDALPKGVEAAVVTLPAPLAVEAAEACVAQGIRSLVVIAQGFGESGADGKERDDRLLALTRNHKAAIVGPNTNGIINAQSGLALSIAPIMQYQGWVKPGRIGVVSQSGAMLSSLLTQLAKFGLGIGKTATCGNELVLSVADYLTYLADDPQTDIVVMYLETIRDARAFRKALARAQSVGKHVVAIKVGESDSGKMAALSHTGAIAGSYRNTLALLEQGGAYIADDLETLAAITECLVRFGPSGIDKPFVASISGGFAIQTADVMGRVGIPLQPTSEACKRELEALPSQSHGVNPYDIAAQNNLIPDVIDTFRRDGFNMLLFGFSLLKREIYEDVKQKILWAKQAGMSKIILFSPIVESQERDFFNERGIALHDNSLPMLKALRAIEKHRSLEEVHTSTVLQAHRERTPISRTKLPNTPGLLDEVRSKEIVARCGIPIPRSRVFSAEAPPESLEDLRFPLAMKGLSKKIAHKTEHQLVALQLGSSDEVISAWESISNALTTADPTANEILIEEMVGTGMEAIVGLQRDPQIGPVIVVGAGGILCELLDDNVVLVPPFTSTYVLHALAETRFGRLLMGFRGQRFDISALSEAAEVIAELALREPQIESIDLNPILVQPDNGGVIAVDAKVVLSAARPE